MTVTEKKYSKYIGKLFWSNNRQSLVTIEGIKRAQYGNRWKFNIYYSDPTVDQQNRTINAVRVEQLIEAGHWIPADQYIKNQPPVSSAK